jgi:hypothetical protein
MIPVFIPAGCTDEIQVLDVCCNKPFKQAAKAHYRNWLHLNFNQFVAAGNNAEELNPPPHSMRVLKPLMYEYVEKGIIALRAPHMTNSIKEAFAKYARLEKCRDPDRIQLALQRSGTDINNIIQATTEHLWIKFLLSNKIKSQS